MLKNGNWGRCQRACAACKYGQQSCGPHCVFRQNFPSEKKSEFASVKKIFGFVNLKRMMNSVGTQEERDQVAESMCWEAQAWTDDPIQGPYGQFKRLEQQLEEQREHCNTHHTPLPENNRQYEPQVAESNGTPTIENCKYSNGNDISPVMGSYLNGYITSLQPSPETDQSELIPNSYCMQSGCLNSFFRAQHNSDQSMNFINGRRGFN